MRAITTSILLAALAATSAAGAEPRAAKSVPEKVPAIQPEAIDALKKMGAFLREQKDFSVTTETETDYVLDNGQKVRMESHGTLKVERPTHLHAAIKSDRKEREFFYDGKTFTMFSPKVGYYTQIDAPPTIRELADQLQLQYGLELPLVDLFRWGSDEPGGADFSDITAATVVGPSEIDGVKTDQYAFRQEGLDWQIWIDQGDKPLPRKVVLTTTDDKTRPERAVAMTWKLGESHDDSLFTFEPPKNAMKIGIAELGALRGDTKQSAQR
jgi:hypothetical protein